MLVTIIAIILGSYLQEIKTDLTLFFYFIFPFDFLNVTINFGVSWSLQEKSLGCKNFPAKTNIFCLLNSWCCPSLTLAAFVVSCEFCVGLHVICSHQTTWKGLVCNQKIFSFCSVEDRQESYSPLLQKACRIGRISVQYPKDESWKWQQTALLSPLERLTCCTQISLLGLAPLDLRPDFSSLFFFLFY